VVRADSEYLVVRSQSTVSEEMVTSCSSGFGPDAEIGIEKTTRSSTRAISP
jgi:hypothetical protein